MVRFAYLIPRIIIIALIGLAVWVGSDPLIRRVVVSHLQNATGAKVDIGQLRYSLSNHKIYLKEVAIADPRSPMQNLLQAEMAYLELDAMALLRRKVVIERGETSRVAFGAPRSVSGGLPDFPQPDGLAEFDWKPKQFSAIDELGLEWVDSFPQNNSTPLIADNFQLVQASRQLHGFWKEQLENQFQQIVSLTNQRSILMKAMADDGNPLRRGHVNTDSDFTSLASTTKTIQTKLLELERTALNQRAQLQLAYDQDIQNLMQSVQTTRFDGTSVSDLLLTRFQEERISEIVSLFHWFRTVVPDPDSDFQPKRKRGTDLLLSGVNPSPGFLIKSIDLEGEGRFANQHLKFAGTAFNLTNQPRNHDQPASFELRAQGAQHLIVSCTLDRRQEIFVDSIDVVCPDMQLSEQMLGEENSMLVTMGPSSRIQADIHLNAVGDELSGELVFRHSNVSLHVDKLHRIVGGDETALQMNQGLATVDRFETKVTLSGTLTDYEYQFQSDLGSKFSIAANELLSNKRNQIIQRHKKKLDELLATQLANLNETIMPEIQKLGRILEAERVEIASRQYSQSEPESRLPKIH